MSGTSENAAGEAGRVENFEKALERLDKIVTRLEAGDAPLEKGLALYKEGRALVASCRRRLDAARLEIERVTGEGLEPFDLSGEAAGDESHA